MNLKSITNIRNNIMNLINKNQNIKRYIIYLTGLPLEKEFEDNEGKIIKQPDIEEDLIFKNQHIYPFSYSETNLDESQIKMFIQEQTGEIKDNVIGKHTIKIDIVIPLKYNLLDNSGDRSLEIGCEITNLIDNSKLSNGIEKCKVVKYEVGRPKNGADFNILSLFIECNSLTNNR